MPYPTRARTFVGADGSGVVGHAGGRLPTNPADAAGLTAALPLPGRRGPAGGHDPGRIAADLPVMPADGTEAVADLALLWDETDVFGSPTTHRTHILHERMASACRPCRVGRALHHHHPARHRPALGDLRRRSPAFRCRKVPGMTGSGGRAVPLFRGVDLLRAGELDCLVERDWFRRLLYSADERREADTLSPSRRREFLAGRFAAKEAVLKMMGTGLLTGVPAWQVDISRSAAGAPEFDCRELPRIGPSMSEWAGSPCHSRSRVSSPSP
ncbi:4'-phosphopantetheinyl transferase superfamily protein [Streptomyces sp. NPDC006654]|uniref:4'-phosphopantetheinyl transferase superfamily protein n=1 Tax=Streptomyces sp. NPDC006654 TaxID=3156897 RepID=UPI0033DBDFCB